MSSGRNTTIRDKHRRIIARDEPLCGICGHPINYALPHTDPLSYHVDHIIPIDKGGPDTLANKQATHRRCNRLKANQLPANPLNTIRTYTTTRTW